MFKKYEDEDEVVKDIMRPHSSDDSDPDEWWNRWNRFALRLIVSIIAGCAFVTGVSIFLWGPIYHEPLGLWVYGLTIVSLIVAWEIL